MNPFSSDPGILIPIVGMLIPIVAIISGIWSKAHSERIRADQRLAMLARGHSPSEIESVLGAGSDDNQKSIKDPLRSLGNARRAAVVLISVGLGLIAFFTALAPIVGNPRVFAGAAVGLIPLLIGLGFVVDYQLQQRELARFGLEIDTVARDN